MTLTTVTADRKQIENILGQTSELSRRPLSLEEFLEKNMEVPRHLRTVEEFASLVERLELSQRFLQKHILFKSDRYYWQPILENPDIEILVCCWLPGQSSGIHLHKGTALNATKVLMGGIVQEYYEPDESALLVRRSAEEVSVGNVTWVDRYQFHQLVNQSAENCVTLHFYSPARQD